MITSLLLSLFAVVAVSLISLVGVLALSVKAETIRKYIFFLVSLAVGALLGDAFIHLIPESFEAGADSTTVSLLIIAGLIFFFVMEKFLHWHHHGDDVSEIHPVGKLVLFSDGVHNFIDGLIIGISFIASVPLGIATTLAVMLHEIPQEIGDFAVLLHAGYTRKRALWFNFISSLAAMLGVLVAFVIGEAGETFVHWILPLGAGGFIYIAVADLIPELHKVKSAKQSLSQIAALVLGVILMLLLVFLE